MTEKKTDEYSDMVERRKDLRIPVQFNMAVDVEDKKTGLFFQTFLMSYSTGGICVAWDLCKECSGYSPGEIHHDCIFAPFDIDRKNSRDLAIHVHIPETDDVLDIKGKAVYTFKDIDGEQIGIAFSKKPGKLISILDEVCKGIEKDKQGPITKGKTIKKK